MYVIEHYLIAIAMATNILLHNGMISFGLTIIYPQHVIIIKDHFQ